MRHGRLFICHLLGAVAMLLSWSASAKTHASQIVIQELELHIPEEWTLQQDAIDAATMIFTFNHGGQRLNIYAKKGTNLSMQETFVNGSTVLAEERVENFSGLNWQILETKMSRRDKAVVHVAAFKTELNGFTYFGYSRSSTQSQALDSTRLFLESMKRRR